jgi:trans-aconitate methyltransferase
MRDIWQVADAYERYIGRWSRPIAREFVSLLSVPPGGSWIDVGCGSGALTDAILALAAPASVLSLDRSFDFVAQAGRTSRDARAALIAGDAVRLPVRDGLATAAVSGLVLNFVSHPELAVREMLRCVQPGGTVATYLWDYAAGMQIIRLFWDAATSIDIAAAELDEARRFPLCRPDALEQLFTSAGANQISVTSITIPAVFENFDDLWTPFLGGQGPAPAYAASLSGEKRAELRERLRQLVSENAHGSIELSARAWVARGVRRSS